MANQWNFGVTCQPAGMGIDPGREVALIGCLDPTAGYPLVWDLKAGHEIRTLSDIGDADQVIYDAASGQFMVAGQNNGTTALGFFGGSPVGFLNLRTTHADSRAVAYEEATKMVSTPHAKPGNEGLLNLPLPEPQSPAPPFVAPLLYLLPLLVLGFALWYYGRSRSLERRLAGRPMYS